MRLYLRFILLLACVTIVMFRAQPTWAGTTERVSVASDGTQGNDDSLTFFSDQSISADGRYVAFSSDASNLVPGDTNRHYDIFVRDRVTGITERVSVASDGTQENADATSISISADGRYVAFASGASNLVPGDTNGVVDVFVRDRVMGTTERISVASDGTQENDNSGAFSMSADGRYVAFASFASNLVPGDTNGMCDAFVRDRVMGTTERVSVASDGREVASDGRSVYEGIIYHMSLSADGRYVAFVDDASNLVPGDTNMRDDVFVHDRMTGTTERVSVANDGTQGNYSSGDEISISADGRYVAFASDSLNLVPGDTNMRNDVFVRDRMTGATERVSVASDGTQGNCGSFGYVSLSADGRYVAFFSCANNLVPGDNNGMGDIFVRDRLTGTTERVSVASDGTQGNDDSYYNISLSADGRYIAFTSYASNLVPGDTNAYSDVFVRDRGTGGGISSGLNITAFTLSPGPLSKGSNVTAWVTSAGASNVRLRIQGLRRDQPAIQMTKNGSNWTASINGSLANWAQGGCLQVYADAYDGLGNSASACRTLSISGSTSPVGTGLPNNVWVDESNGCGILKGSAEILGTNPLKARLSMSTDIAWFLSGESGPMNIWPSVTEYGVPVSPANCYTLGAFLAEFDRFSPSGGPTYDATFSKSNTSAYFVADMDCNSFGLSLWDTAAGVVDGPVSASDLLATFNAFAFLGPVQTAMKRFQPKPSSSELPKAMGLAAWDLSEFVRNGTERDRLRDALQAAIRRKRNDPNFKIQGWSWLAKVAKALSAYDLIKISRDWVVWTAATWNNKPSLCFKAYATPNNGLAVHATSTGEPIGLIREQGMTVDYSQKPSGANTQCDFTLSNTKGSPIWEWRLTLDADQPQPTSISAPPGWSSELVWNMSEQCVRWYTEGPTGWASGDYGQNTLPQGSSLSGFSVEFANKPSQCGYSSTDTDQKLDGGIINMMPSVTAVPPDFIAGTGQTTFIASLDRPANASLKVIQGTTVCAVPLTDRALSAGQITTDWNGTDAAGKTLPIGDYQGVLSLTYTDGDSTELTVPLSLMDPSTLPVVAITSPTSGTTYSATASKISIGGTSSNAVTLTWDTDKGFSGTCTGTSTWSASGIQLRPGQNVITVTARDAAGNEWTSTITVTYTDVTPPTIKITVPTTAATYATTTQALILRGFTSDNVGVTAPKWSSNRGGSGTCTIDRGTWATSKITLQPGANVFTVAETDAAGNKGTAMITVTYTDVTPPMIKITVPTTAATYATTTQSLIIRGFTSDNVGVTAPKWSSNRGGSGTCTIDRGTWATSKITLQPGANVFTVAETDAAGNKGTAMITVTYTDVTPPMIKITVPTTAATYATTTQSLIIRGFTSDNVGVTAPTWSSNRGGSGTCTIDRGTWATSKVTLQPGANVFTVTSTDAAGNKGTARVTVTYTDVTSPVVKITVPTNASTYTTTASSVILKGFTSDNVGVTSPPTWSSDRGGSGTCTIDRGTWATNKITIQLGVNVLTVTEMDAAGNKGSASIQVVR